jgi:hypothetical protein
MRMGRRPIRGRLDDPRLRFTGGGPGGSGGGGFGAIHLSDQHFANVITLIHFTGPNGSTTFTDVSSVAEDWLPGGDAQIQSNKLELDGTDKLITLDRSAYRLNGDFCHELFGVEWDVIATTRLLGQYAATGSQGSWIWDYLSTEDRLRLIITATGSSPSTNPVGEIGSFNPSAATAYDLCLERSGTDLRAYVNGTMVGKITLATNSFDSTAALELGRVDEILGLDGKMKAMRLTNAARYATDTSYPVPNLPLPTS